ncbi:uncharacterized protein L199_005609 [Kwoniella botswanensis]|uniref:uncharacterized protein n=1 Tax=Kwoniella botswanensis TaxID=1268659 RepID=UPI00315D8E30
MPRKKSQAKKVGVTDGLVNLLSDPCVINVGSSVGNLTSRTSAIGALPRTITPNIHKIGRDTRATTNKYTTSKAPLKWTLRRRSEGTETVEAKELESIQLTKRYTPKPASFESLRIMDWSRISQCWDHNSEECWYHKQINCTNYRKTTHFANPIRYPRALGRGLEIGSCKDCKKDGCPCSVSSENDRFYGLSYSLDNPPVIHRIDTSQGKLVEGKVDMRVLLEDSNGDEGKDKKENREEGGRSVTPRVANTTLKHGSKRQRPLDSDSDPEESNRSHAGGSRSGQLNRVRRRIIVSPKDNSEIIIHSGNHHDDQDPSSTLRSSASLISDCALPLHPLRRMIALTCHRRPLQILLPPPGLLPVTSQTARTLHQLMYTPIRHHVPTAAQLQVTRLKNKLRDQGERLDKMMKDNEVIMAKLGQVFMERDEAVRERNELAKEVDRLREILGDTKG